jgi:ABC-type nitrate/sulfonate/bicarbonate transport system permease component
MMNEPMKLPALRWMKFDLLPSFLIQTIIATAGAMVTGTVLSFIVSAAFAILAANASSGNFVDRVVDQSFFRWADRTNLVIILSALGFGVFARRTRSRVAGFVWILPAVILVWNLLTWRGAGALTAVPYWEAVWNNYFADCGSSECLYKLFVTVPFYTSAAYSLAWAAGKHLLQNPAVKVRA